MKRMYTKPMIGFENMELNSAVAACAVVESTRCDFEGGFAVESVYAPGTLIFTSEIPMCTTVHTCYHNSSKPIDDMILHSRS